MSDLFERGRAVMKDAQLAGAFPSAVCEVGCAAGPVWAEAFGRLSYDDDATATTTETIFDLASLTKVMVTTSLVMALVRQGDVVG